MAYVILSLLHRYLNLHLLLGLLLGPEFFTFIVRKTIEKKNVLQGGYALNKCVFAFGILELAKRL